jgi:hypothetical protein
LVELLKAMPKTETEEEEEYGLLRRCRLYRFLD